jgi:hypothetical protein
VTRRQHTPADQTFEETRNFVHKLLNSFARAYPYLDRDDLTSAAYYGWTQAYQTFRHELGYAFLTWVGEKVDKRLKDVLRRTLHERRKNARTVRIETGEDWTGGHDGNTVNVPDREPTPQFPRVEWFDSLSPDAQVVATLALDSPIDVRLILSQFGVEDGGAWRQAIREHLGEAGWGARRLKRTFLEIRGAL